MSYEVGSLLLELRASMAVSSEVGAYQVVLYASGTVCPSVVSVRQALYSHLEWCAPRHWASGPLIAAGPPSDIESADWRRWCSVVVLVSVLSSAMS